MQKHGTASGWYIEFQGAVLNQLPRDIDSAIANGWTKNQKALKKVLREALLPNEKSVVKTYPTDADYFKLAEEMVRSGWYDWANSNIFSQYFYGKTGTAVEIIHFNRLIGISEVLKELDRRGYRPAEPYELFAFGEKHPEIQGEFPIIALGPVWQLSHGSIKGPYVCDHPVIMSHRSDLCWHESGWNETYRFAAVRK